MRKTSYLLPHTSSQFQHIDASLQSTVRKMAISVQQNVRKMVKTPAHTNITTREVVVSTKFFTQMHVNACERNEKKRRNQIVDYDQSLRL